MRRILAAHRHNGRPEVFVMPLPLPHRTHAAPACRHCGAPLDALQAARGEACARPACRHRRDLLHEHQARRRLTGQLRLGLADRLGQSTAAALSVSWIVPHDATLVELPADARASLKARLLQLAQDDGAALPAADADCGVPAADADCGVPAADADCGVPAADAGCGGRCCRHGRAANAFLEAGHLRRWQRQHPGRSLQDAAAAYLDRLPAHHVEDSCLYHGAQGCTLGRDWRSDICNRFACDGLQQLHQDGAAPARVFAMRAQGRVTRMALCTPAGLQVLPPDAAA